MMIAVSSEQRVHTEQLEQAEVLTAFCQRPSTKIGGVVRIYGKIRHKKGRFVLK